MMNFLKRSKEIELELPQPESPTPAPRLSENLLQRHRDVVGATVDWLSQRRSEIEEEIAFLQAEKAEIDKLIVGHESALKVFHQ